MFTGRIDLSNLRVVFLGRDYDTYFTRSNFMSIFWVMILVCICGQFTWRL